MSGDLEQVRSELKRLGYLSHGLERYLLQDALRPQRPARTLAHLTLKVALPAGLVLALAAAFALAAANGNLTATPFDLLALVVHLVPPAVLAAAGAFLALAGVVMLVLRLSHVRRIEALSLAAAVAAVVGLLALAAPRAADLFAGSRPWQVAALAAGLPVVAYVLVKLVNHGLLSLAIRLSDATPRWRLFSRRWASLAVLAAGFLLTLPTVLAARRGTPPPAPALPTTAGERVLLVGIDGVLAQEIDYLLAIGDLPVLGRLAGMGSVGGVGGAVLRYARAEEPPAAFWTSVATGLPSPDHGVAALDTFRPRGVATPLARVGPLRPYFAEIAVPLGLAEHRALLANRRRAWAVWELAARGGAPVVAVDWWATFPAAPLPGLIVAHGAYQLLPEDTEAAAGAVAPGAARAGLTELRAAVAGAAPRELAAALPAAAGEGGLRARDRPRPFLPRGVRAGPRGQAPRRRPLPAGPRHRGRRLDRRRRGLRRPGARRAGRDRPADRRSARRRGDGGGRRRPRPPRRPARHGRTGHPLAARRLRQPPGRRDPHRAGGGRRRPAARARPAAERGAAGAASGLPLGAAGRHGEHLRRARRPTPAGTGGGRVPREPAVAGVSVGLEAILAMEVAR